MTKMIVHMEDEIQEIVEDLAEEEVMAKEEILEDETLVVEDLAEKVIMIDTLADKVLVEEVMAIKVQVGQAPAEEVMAEIDQVAMEIIQGQQNQVVQANNLLRKVLHGKIKVSLVLEDLVQAEVVDLIIQTEEVREEIIHKEEVQADQEIVDQVATHTVDQEITQVVDQANVHIVCQVVVQTLEHTVQ